MVAPEVGLGQVREFAFPAFRYLDVPGCELGYAALWDLAPPDAIATADQQRQAFWTDHGFVRIETAVIVVRQRERDSMRICFCAVALAVAGVHQQQECCLQAQAAASEKPFVIGGRLTREGLRAVHLLVDRARVRWLGTRNRSDSHSPGAHAGQRLRDGDLGSVGCAGLVRQMAGDVVHVVLLQRSDW